MAVLGWGGPLDRELLTARRDGGERRSIGSRQRDGKDNHGQPLVDSGRETPHGREIPARVGARLLQSGGGFRVDSTEISAAAARGLIGRFCIEVVIRIGAVIVLVDESPAIPSTRGRHQPAGIGVRNLIEVRHADESPGIVLRAAANGSDSGNIGQGSAFAKADESSNQRLLTDGDVRTTHGLANGITVSPADQSPSKTVIRTVDGAHADDVSEGARVKANEHSHARSATLGDTGNVSIHDEVFDCALIHSKQPHMVLSPLVDDQIRDRISLSVKGAGEALGTVAKRDPVGGGSGGQGRQSNVGRQRDVCVEKAARVLIDELELGWRGDLEYAMDVGRSVCGTRCPGWRERQGQTAGDEDTTKAEDSEQSARKMGMGRKNRIRLLEKNGILLTEYTTDRMSDGRRSYK